MEPITSETEILFIIYKTMKRLKEYKSNLNRIIGSKYTAHIRMYELDNSSRSPNQLPRTGAGIVLV